jgi:hypothetical protein
MTMADKRPLDELELDGLFAAARETAPRPSAALVERIIADADTERAVPAAPAPRRGVLAGVLASIGGWPAAAGLATAAVTGLMIGLATPDTVETLTGGYLAADMAYDLEDLMPSFDDLLVEG